MGQLSLILLVAIAGWLGYRTYARGRDKLEHERRLREKNRGITELEYDAKTGTYRTDERKPRR